MKFAFYFLGTSWLLASIGSTILVLCKLLNRHQLLIEIKAAWNTQGPAGRFAARLLIMIAAPILFLPMIYPIPTFLLSFIFLGLT
jgi:hypothetical protein